MAGIARRRRVTRPTGFPAGRRPTTCRSRTSAGTARRGAFNARPPFRHACPLPQRSRYAASSAAPPYPAEVSCIGRRYPSSGGSTARTRATPSLDMSHARRPPAPIPRARGSAGGTSSAPPRYSFQQPPSPTNSLRLVGHAGSWVTMEHSQKCRSKAKQPSIAHGVELRRIFLTMPPERLRLTEVVH